ncbi:MAG: hypothetical protein AB8F95_05675, partial [Bacteroidia bacterium]
MKTTKRIVLLAYCILLCWGTGIAQNQFAPYQIDAEQKAVLDQANNDLLSQGSASLNNADMPPVYIDDSRAPGTIIHMDEDMYNTIRDWMLAGNQQTVSLTSVLQGQYNTDRINDFMLKFSSGDSSYFLNPATGAPIQARVNGDPVCRCKYLSFSDPNDPIDPTNPQYASVGVTPATPTVFADDVFGGLNYNKLVFREAFGAGRAERVGLVGINVGDRTHNLEFGDDAKVTMRIMYLCTDQNELPSDCGCDQQLHVQGDFRGDMFALANTGGIFNSKVHAQVEVGMVLAEYTVGPTFTDIKIEAARKASAVADRDETWDPEALMSFTDLAKKTLTELTKKDPSPTTLITDAAGQILDLVGNQNLITSTNNATAPVSIMGYGDASPLISPLTEKVFLMSSVTMYDNRVKTGIWNWGLAGAGFASAYRMHLWVDFRNVNSDCCMEKYGMWAHGGYDLDITDESGLDQISWTSDLGVGPDLQILKTDLENSFHGNWETFDSNEAYGSTVDLTQTCDCNVRPVMVVTDQFCGNVTLDISGSTYPDDYFLEVSEVDSDGDYIGNYARTNGWVSAVPPSGIIHLSTSASPLMGGAYSFSADKFYKIKFAVNGHCTGWSATETIIKTRGAAKPLFDVTSQVCNDVSIDRSKTTGAYKYWLSVWEVDALGQEVNGTSQTTGSVNTLPQLLDLDDPTGPLGGYPFVGGKSYNIRLAVKGACDGWKRLDKIIKITPTTMPIFTIAPTCSTVIFDGRDTENETAFEIRIIEVNTLGAPIGIETSVTGGYQTGTIASTYDLKQVYTMVPGKRYRVTLNVTNSCSGVQTKSEFFTYQFDPLPELAGLTSTCEGLDYEVNIGNSVSVESFRMEVFESSQFGAPIGPIIDFTNGWVPFSTQNPAVLISPTPQMTFLENKWYSIRLYGRNTCSPTDKMDL